MVLETELGSQVCYMGTLPLPNTRVSKQKIADIFLKEKGLPAKSKGHGIKVGTGWVAGASDHLHYSRETTQSNQERENGR